MSRTLAIAQRELLAQFFSPVGYVVTALFVWLSCMQFFSVFRPGMPATLHSTLAFLVFWVLTFIAPGLSMRVVSEEYRSGTIEPLMTSPVSDVQVIVGKWLGIWSFYLCMLLLTFVLLGSLLFACADPDLGPLITQLLGMMLAGGMCLAIGVAASAMTPHQVLAFLLTSLIMSFLTYGLDLILRLTRPPAWLQQALYYARADTHFEEFNRGVIHSGSLIYYISTVILALFIAVKCLESRRWR